MRLPLRFAFRFRAHLQHESDSLLLGLVLCHLYEKRLLSFMLCFSQQILPCSRQYIWSAERHTGNELLHCLAWSLFIFLTFLSPVFIWSRHRLMTFPLWYSSTAEVMGLVHHTLPSFIIPSLNAYASLPFGSLGISGELLDQDTDQYRLAKAKLNALERESMSPYYDVFKLP